MKKYFILDHKNRYESSLEDVQEWLLRRVWHQTCLPPYTTFEEWLDTLNGEFEGITAREIWNTISEERRKDELAELETRQKTFLETLNRAMNHSGSGAGPDLEPLVGFVFNGKEVEIPYESFEALMDKLAYLAWKAAHLKMPGMFSWRNAEIELSVTDFEFPHAHDAFAVCAHLLSYGLLEDFQFGFSAGRCNIVKLSNSEITQYMKFAKEAHKPLYKWIYENCLPSAGWGGSRPNAGRKGNRTSAVSARVPEAVLEKLKAEAEAEGVSISAKVAEVLKAWADQTAGSEE